MNSVMKMDSRYFVEILEGNRRFFHSSNMSDIFKYPVETRIQIMETDHDLMISDWNRGIRDGTEGLTGRSLMVEVTFPEIIEDEYLVVGFKLVREE